MGWLGRLVCYTDIRMKLSTSPTYQLCKSSISTVTLKEVSSSHVLSRFDMKEFFITVSGAQHLVKLYDTAGQEEYDQLRQSFYKDADCFVVCFSVDNRTSYNNIIPFWMKELSTFVKHVPIVLCGELIKLFTNQFQLIPKL